jgi:hypothetical protein
MRVVKKGLLWVLMLVIAWGAAVVSGVLARPTAEQSAALNVLLAPLPSPGERNAYAALWLSPWDVPQQDQAKVMDDDIAAWGRYRERQVEGAKFESTAKGKYPDVARPAGKDAQLCLPWDASCLDVVRADPAAVRAILGRYAVLARQSRDLAQFDHFRMLLPWTLDAPLPSFSGYSQVELGAAALKAVEGDSMAALADTCRFAATWRRLRAHSDALIADMIGVAYVSGASRLAAEILAEMPAGTAWPAECDSALAPLADSELDQCTQMRSEFGGVEDAIVHPETLDPEVQTFWYRSLINSHRLAAAIAPAYSRFCGMAAPRDRMPPLDASTSQCTVQLWTFDPFGCAAQADGLPPDLSRYHNRLLDLDARLKALQTARWLRTHPTGIDLATRPTTLQTPVQPMTLSADGRQLAVTLLDENAQRNEWSIPVVATVAVPSK